MSTIQPIGKKPVTAPSTVARSDMSVGMPKITMTTRLATMSAITAAMCAFTLLDAISTEQRDDRQCRGNGRQRSASERIIDLVPHV